MATTGSISPFSAPETASVQVERDGAVSCRLVGDAAEREIGRAHV